MIRLESEVSLSTECGVYELSTTDELYFPYVCEKRCTYFESEKPSDLSQFRNRVYTLCEREKLRRYTCILSIRNARHNACRAFRTITCLYAIG